MLLLTLLLALLAAPALAQPKFPPLTGRIVDAANILPPEAEISIGAKLQQLETTTTRQLVVATVPDLGGYEIADYGYQLGRAWGIGQAEDDNGVILLVAPNERRVRIEVGYGLEPVLTDAMSSLIIQRQILPAFREGDMPRGVAAGVDAIVEQLQLPPEQAQANAARAAEAQAQAAQQGDGGGFGFGSIIWLFIIFFWLLPALFGRGRRGRRYRRSSGVAEAILWGMAANAMSNRSRGGWGGGGGFGGGGFGGGGFGGGGGSFGGGGASGGW